MNRKSAAVPKVWKDRHTLFLLFAYLLLVLISTLFPFDFSIRFPASWQSALSAVDWELNTRFAWNEFLRNIFLFIPLGFGLAYHLRKWRFPALLVLLLAVSLGACFSIGIEILQQSIPQRVSTFTDIIANSLGTLLGLMGFFLVGRQLVEAAASIRYKIANQMGVGALLFLTLGYAGLVLITAGLLQYNTSLERWSPIYPISLGNEPSGEHPWQGSIDTLFIANRALDAQQIEQVMQGADPRSIAGSSLGAYYNFQDGGPYQDAAGVSSGLSWQVSSKTASGAAGAQFDRKRWLMTAAPADQLVNAVRQTSQFTLSLIAAPASDKTNGLANILNISGDDHRTNLSLIQDSSSLVVRLRNGITGENGRHPELMLPGVWSGTQKRHIILTYDGSVARFYVDSPVVKYSFEFSPEVALVWGLSLADTGGIRLDSNHQFVVKLLFYAVFFIPFGWLLLLWQRNARADGLWNLVFVIPGSLLPAILLQTVLAWIPRGTSDRLLDFLLPVFFTILTMLYFQDVGNPHRAQRVTQAKDHEAIPFIRRS